MNWFDLFVAACLTLAGSGVLSFARSQYNRWQAHLIVWLAIPMFTVSLLFIYSAFALPDSSDMDPFFHWGFILIGLLTGIIMHLMAYIQRGYRGKRD